MIELKKITKIYESKKKVKTIALDDVSLNFSNKGMTFILGKSGSGKSTLLNIIGTLDTKTSGDIIINNKNTNNWSKKDWDSYRNSVIGFIFQDFNLLDTLTAYENIALALTIKRDKNIDKKIEVISKKLGISDVLNKYPYQLSGGQKQRVACCRALITNPKLVLADEPTGALDSKSSRLLLEKINELNADLKTTILMVTHDAFTASYCSRILFIKDGKIFNELIRGDDSRREFFDKIIDVVTVLGGDLNDAL